MKKDKIIELTNENNVFKYSIKPQETLYFKHLINSSDFRSSQSLLSFYSSNNNSEIYISSENSKPTAENSAWTFQNKIPSKNAVFPFFITKDEKIEFCEDLELNFSSKNIHGLLIFENEEQPIKILYIALKNSNKNLTLQGQISLRCIFFSTIVKDFQINSILPSKFQSLYQKYFSIYSQIDGSKLSRSERLLKNIDASEFTYGEIDLLHFIPILESCGKNGKSEIFYDLGCGTGKALIAAYATKMFKKICGVDLLENLCNAAIKCVKAVCENYEIFEIDRNDILKTDWLNTDILFISSICFPEDLMEKIIEMGKGLKKGTRIISLTEWKNEKFFKTIYQGTIKMTWGNPEVFIMLRI